ncbi:hypothetical protein ANO11243_097410 [Dothideomycetidae sp. 11243]|nr:hypothetical protein ANO11243_097410 [fungal sp. No.11243]
MAACKCETSKPRSSDRASTSTTATSETPSSSSTDLSTSLPTSTGSPSPVTDQGPSTSTTTSSKWTTTTMATTTSAMHPAYTDLLTVYRVDRDGALLVDQVYGNGTLANSTNAWYLGTSGIDTYFGIGLAGEAYLITNDSKMAVVSPGNPLVEITGVGFEPFSSVCATQQAAGFDVFAIDTQGGHDVVYKTYSGDTYHGPATLEYGFEGGTTVLTCSPIYGPTLGASTASFGVYPNGNLQMVYLNAAKNWDMVTIGSGFTPGCHLATSHQGGTSQKIGLFSIDNTGALTAMWNDNADTTWTTRAHISGQSQFTPCAPVFATSSQSLNQTYVFAVDLEGYLTVTYASDNGTWSGPSVISAAPNFSYDTNFPGFSQYEDQDQPHVFMTDKSNDLWIFWLTGSGTWENARVQ